MVQPLSSGILSHSPRASYIPGGHLGTRSVFNGNVVENNASVSLAPCLDASVPYDQVLQMQGSVDEGVGLRSVQMSNVAATNSLQNEVQRRFDDLVIYGGVVPEISGGSPAANTRVQILDTTSPDAPGQPQDGENLTLVWWPALNQLRIFLFGINLDITATGSFPSGQFFRYRLTYKKATSGSNGTIILETQGFGETAWVERVNTTHSSQRTNEFVRMRCLPRGLNGTTATIQYCEFGTYLPQIDGQPFDNRRDPGVFDTRRVEMPFAFATAEPTNEIDLIAHIPVGAYKNMSHVRFFFSASATGEGSDRVANTPTYMPWQPLSAIDINTGGSSANFGMYKQTLDMLLQGTRYFWGVEIASDASGANARQFGLVRSFITRDPNSNAPYNTITWSCKAHHGHASLNDGFATAIAALAADNKELHEIFCLGDWNYPDNGWDGAALAGLAPPVNRLDWWQPFYQATLDVDLHDSLVDTLFRAYPDDHEFLDRAAGDARWNGSQVQRGFDVWRHMFRRDGWAPPFYETFTPRSNIRVLMADVRWQVNIENPNAEQNSAITNSQRVWIDSVLANANESQIIVMAQGALGRISAQLDGSIYPSDLGSSLWLVDTLKNRLGSDQRVIFVMGDTHAGYVLDKRFEATEGVINTEDDPRFMCGILTSGVGAGAHTGTGVHDPYTAENAPFVIAMYPINTAGRAGTADDPQDPLSISSGNANRTGRPDLMVSSGALIEYDARRASARFRMWVDDLSAVALDQTVTHPLDGGFDDYVGLGLGLGTG